MPPIPGSWHSLLARHGRIWKAAYREATRTLEAKLGRVPQQVEYAYARVPARQAVHPAARIRQAQSGWLSSPSRFASAVRYLTTQAAVAPRKTLGRSSAGYQTATWNAIKQSPGRAPFASTLRPNLTGGTLGRTAGGYTLGAGRIGGQRFFSHGPAAPAQVVQNVSQAVRAFAMGGHKAQFNGVDPITGNKRYRTVTKLQHETGKKITKVPKATPGSYVAFNVNPTVTALTPLRSVTGFEASSANDQHLNTDGLLEGLSVDFSRQLQELCIVLGDIKKFSTLGDLPITYHDSSLRIHFPGCDADSVERLCSELSIRRGVVVQDEEFDTFAGTEMALLFPFAPSHEASDAGDMFETTIPHSAHKAAAEPIDWQEMMSPGQHTSDYSTRSEHSLDMLEAEDESEWLSQEVELEQTLSEIENEQACSSEHSPLEYQGIEGIYRFIEQCDSAGARRH